MPSDVHYSSHDTTPPLKTGKEAGKVSRQNITDNSIGGPDPTRLPSNRGTLKRTF